MDQNDESLLRLAEDLSAGISDADGGAIDLDECRKLAIKLVEKARDAQGKIPLAEKLFCDFKESILSRANAIESLTGRAGISSQAAETIKEAGADFERLDRLRKQVNAEFNRTFATAARPSQENQAVNRTSYQEFKCGKHHPD